MKTSAFVFLLMVLTGSINCQNIHPENYSGKESDSVYWTSTEYPVRLMNDIAELKTIISDNLTLYPEDLEKSFKVTYQFKVNRNGFRIKSSVNSYEGDQALGLQKRVLKILDDNCIWSPAKQDEIPVNAFYYLTISFEKGKIVLIPQNKYE